MASIDDLGASSASFGTGDRDLLSPASTESAKVPLEASYINSPTSLDSTTIIGQSAVTLKKAPLILNLKGNVCYTWKNLSVQVKVPKKSCKRRIGPTHKLILNESTGCVKSGEIWALMGSSGAGKTTLLNTLNFRTSSKLHVTGDRCINGAPVGPHIISSISAYVQQDDLLFPRLTVNEHLNFCASLRLPAETSRRDKRRRVNEVLQELGLWNVKNHKIGSPTTFKGISGGEKKRLAFASEILSDPNILFCDEPTSGLDSFMAQTVVRIMHKMAARGKIIVCTIHQPSSEVFSMFGYLYLLSEGRLAFAGRREDAKDFFAKQGYVCPATHNPADYFLRVMAIVPDHADECRERSNIIADAFENTEQFEKYAKTASIRKERDVDLEIIEKQSKMKGDYRVGCCRQFCALVKRSIICTFREPSVFAAKLVQHIVLGFVVGSVFYKLPYDVEGAVSLSGCLMMSVSVVVFLPTYACITTFSDEIPIFLREHWNGMYRSWIYFVARSLVDLPLYMFYPWIFFPQVFYLAGYTLPYTRIISHCTTFSILAACGASMGYLAASWSKNIRMTLQVVPTMMLPSLIFSGFFLDEDTTFSFIGWFKYTSVIYLSSENLMLEQWTSVSDVYQTEPFVPELFGDGEGVIDYYNYTPGRQNLNYILLVVWFFVYRLLAYLGLWLKTRR